MNAGVPEEPICTCEDRAWLAQCYVEGDLVDEALIDTGLEDRALVMTMITDVRDKHHMIVNIAIGAGKHWRVICVCPGCHKGMEFDSEAGARVLEGH